jgi:ABC-type multidrug transport system permease subunit
MSSKINWDVLGVSVSVACAIHCAVLPLVLSSLPLFGVNIIENKSFEFAMIVLAFVVGIYSLYHGFKKHHHRWLPIITFSVGMFFLVAKQIFLQYHVVLLVPAVVCIVASHFLNYKFCRQHNHAHKDDCNH